MYSINVTVTKKKFCLSLHYNGANMSFSAHIDNKKKDILVLGISPTQGLEHTLTAEKCTRLVLL